METPRLSSTYVSLIIQLHFLSELTVDRNVNPTKIKSSGTRSSGLIVKYFIIKPCKHVTVRTHQSDTVTRSVSIEDCWTSRARASWSEYADNVLKQALGTKAWWKHWSSIYNRPVVSVQIRLTIVRRSYRLLANKSNTKCQRLKIVFSCTKTKNENLSWITNYTVLQICFFEEFVWKWNQYDICVECKEFFVLLWQKFRHISFITQNITCQKKTHFERLQLKVSWKKLDVYLKFYLKQKIKTIEIEINCESVTKLK